MKKALFLLTSLLLFFGMSAQVQNGQVYIIKNKQSGLNATTGSTVSQTNGTGDNVKWEFIASGSNYQIKNKQSGLYLINSFGVASVKNTPELWAIETLSNPAGHVQIKHISTGKYLKSNNQSPGANGLLLGDKLAIDFGIWHLELEQVPAPTASINELAEYWVMNIGTGLKMTDSGATSSIPQTTQTGNAARWKFIKSGDNWHIKNIGTGKFLGVSANVAIPVAQAQAWAAEAVPLTIGQARLRHVSTGKYLLAQSSGTALLTGTNTGQNTAVWDLQMQISLPTNTGAVGYNILNYDKIKLALLHNLGLPETIPMFEFVRRGVRQYLLNELGRFPSEVEIDNFLLTIENEAMMEDRVKIIIGLRKVITDLALKPAHQLTPLENQLLAHIAEKVRQHNMQFADRVIVEWNKFKALSNAGSHQYSFAPIFVLGAADPDHFSMPSPYVLSPLQEQMLEDYVEKAQESSNIAFAVTSAAIAVPGLSVAIAAGVGQFTAMLASSNGVFGATITSLVGGSTLNAAAAGGTAASSSAATAAAPAFVIIMAAVITGYGAYMITEGVKFEKLLHENKEKASKSVNLQNLVSTPEGFETLMVYLDYHLAVSAPILQNVNRQNGLVMEIVMP